MGKDYSLWIDADDIENMSSPEDREFVIPVEFLMYYGADGTPVIEITTIGLDEDGDGPVCRIYLNNASVYENPKWEYTD